MTVDVQDIAAVAAEEGREIRLRTNVVRAAPAQGVDRQARVIRGYSVVTRGEALGHNMWLDAEFLRQVAESGNAAAAPGSGVKSRFTHPGLCSDGLGTFLGRSRNFRVEGARVLADLHLSDTAQGTPKGDLATYVMDLAEEDPQAFGASIVYWRNRDAEHAFAAEHRDEKGGFLSPDAENRKNLKHARLGSLIASDAVDDPAANPAGFFSEGDEMAARGESVLAWLFLGAEMPGEIALGPLDPARVKAFVRGFFDRHGLSVAVTDRRLLSGIDAEVNSMTAENVSPKPPETPAPDAAALQAQARKAEQDRLAALRAKFPTRPEFVLEQFAKGATVEEAVQAFNALRMAELEAENAALKAQKPAAPPAAPLGAPPVTFGESAGPKSGDWMEAARQFAAEKNLTLGAAIKELARRDPERHRRYVESIPLQARKGPPKATGTEG